MLCEGCHAYGVMLVDGVLCAECDDIYWDMVGGRDQ